MEAETKYRYEKTIRELRERITRLEGDRYYYRTALSEIYDGVTEVVEKGNTAIKVSWLLRRLKRAWREF